MKRVFFYSCCLLLLTHFLLLGLDKFSPNRFSSAYVYPFFKQNWDLFVPPPDTNYELYALLENGGVSDVLGKVKTEHQANLFAGNEALLVALTNSIHFFEKEADYNHTSPGKVENAINFKILVRSVEAYFLNTSTTQVNRIILVVRPLNLNEQPRVYYN